MVIRLHLHDDNILTRKTLEKELKNDIAFELVSPSFDYVEIFKCLDKSLIDIVLISSINKNYDKVTKILSIVHPNVRIIGLQREDQSSLKIKKVHLNSFLCNSDTNYKDIIEAIKYVYNY